MSYEKAVALIKKGVSRPNLFSVRVGGNKIDGDVNKYLDFFCKTADIPSVSAQTLAAVGQEYQGIVREIPGAIIYSKPMQLEIIENSDYLAYKAFRNWFDQISPNANQLRGPGEVGRSIRMNYYNSFVSNIELTKLELPDDASLPYRGDDLNSYYKMPLRVHYINAYPINVGEISLDSNAKNSYVTWNLSFTYESFYIDDDTYTSGRPI